MILKRLTLFLLCLLMVLPVFAQDLDTDELEFLLEDYVSEDDPAVVLYVSVDGESWIGVAGSADLDNLTLAQTDDLFRIGSITKPLVATTILALVDEGEFSLDDRIADYLPDEIVDNVANADVATVRQMLQMTSGIVSYTDTDEFADLFEDDMSRWWTPEEALETIYDYDADFDAGDDYYYSNSNYLLAQIIIEELTGDTLAEALEDYIFSPADMDSCYLETEANFAENIVRGYGDFGNGFEDITEENDGVGMGDGGVICTAEDLAKFLPALYNDGLISDDMLDEMLDDDGWEYGLGIGVYDYDDIGLELSHDGATSGFQSNMIYLVDEDITIVVLTNDFDSEIVEDLTYDALDIALDDF